MGKDINQTSPAARSIFERVDAALETDLSRTCFEGPADALRMTATTQPALLTTSMALFSALDSRMPQGWRASIACAAGHSLGEYSAVVSAGGLELEAAARVVRQRGRYMQDAVPDGQGAMAAVIAPLPAVETLCKVAAENEVLVIETTETVDPQEILDRLDAQMPSGLTLLGADRIAPGVRPQPIEAEYRLTVSDSLRSVVSEAAISLLDRDSVEVRRRDPGQSQSKTLNIRPFINTLEMTGGELMIRVHLTQSGTVRPRELLEVLGLPVDEHMIRLHRSNVTWDTPWTAHNLPDEMPNGTTTRRQESAID